MATDFKPGDRVYWGVGVVPREGVVERVTPRQVLVREAGEGRLVRFHLRGDLHATSAGGGWETLFRR